MLADQQPVLCLYLQCSVCVFVSVYVHMHTCVGLGHMQVEEGDFSLAEASVLPSLFILRAWGTSPRWERCRRVSRVERRGWRPGLDEHEGHLGH